MARVGDTSEPVLDRAPIKDLVLDSTDILIAHLDRCFTFVYVNRAYSEAAGKSPDDLIGKHYFEVFPIEANRAYFRQVLDTGEPVYLYAEPYKPTGERLNREYYRDWSILPVRDERGKTAGITMSGTEVTRRVDEQADHIQIQSSFELLFESRQLLALRAGLDNRVIKDVSHGLVEFLGYPDRDSLRGRSVLAILAFEEADEQLNRMMRERGFITDREAQLKRADGSLVWIEATAWVTTDRDTVEVVIRDIADHRKIREELEYSERLYRQMFERNASVKLLIDPSDGRIVDANHAACSFYGYARNEFQQLCITDINVWPPDEVAAEMQRAEVEERTYFRFPHRLADGSIRQVEVYSGPVEIGGNRLLHSIVHDVTDRVEAERSLAESERRFRDFVEGTDDFVVRVDTTGRYQYANDASMHFLGLAPVDLIGKSAFDFIHEADRARTEKAFAYWVNNRIRSASIQNRQVKANGEFVHVSWNVNMAYDANGVLIGVNGIARDITRLKEIEEALYYTQKQFKAIADYTCDWEYWQDSNGNLLWVNPSVTDLTGYTVRECLSMIGYPLPMVHGDDRERVAEALASDSASDLEFRLVRKDGVVRWMTISWRPIQLDDSPAGIRASVHDITERKEMEQHLLDHQFVQKEIARVINLGWFYHDLPANEVFWSDQLYVLFGKDKNSFTPSYDSLREFIHPDDRDVMKAEFDRLFSEQTMITCEYRIVRGDGDIRNLLGFARMLKNESGESNRVVGAVLDVTERKRHQEEIARAQKLQSLGSVAGGIAHEFNNLLTGVLGNIAMAVGELSVESDAYTMLKEAERIAERTRELTAQLLTFSSGGKPVMREVDLESLVTNTVPLLLKRSTCTASYDIHGDLPAIRGDRVQLTQVINSLVLNAREAMGDTGGLVRLIADVTAINETNEYSLPAGCYVCLRVVDHGLGIADTVRPRIFDPFFTTKPTGQGLGLAASYSIARNHGGHLALEATSGKGSVFALYLPIAAPYEPSLQKAETDSDGERVVRVLVMDDEESLCRLAEKILKRRGYVVDTAFDGSRAIELVRERHAASTHYDFAILDLSVPGDIGGEKALAAIRQICPDIRAIVCSGYAEDPVMADHEAYGFNAALGKPYLPNDLYSVVDSILER